MGFLDNETIAEDVKNQRRAKYWKSLIIKIVKLNRFLASFGVLNLFQILCDELFLWECYYCQKDFLLVDLLVKLSQDLKVR